MAWRSHQCPLIDCKGQTTLHLANLPRDWYFMNTDSQLVAAQSTSVSSCCQHSVESYDAHKVRSRAPSRSGPGL